MSAFVENFGVINIKHEACEGELQTGFRKHKTKTYVCVNKRADSVYRQELENWSNEKQHHQSVNIHSLKLAFPQFNLFSNTNLRKLAKFTNPEPFQQNFSGCLDLLEHMCACQGNSSGFEGCL